MVGKYDSGHVANVFQVCVCVCVYRGEGVSAVCVGGGGGGRAVLCEGSHV